MALITCSWSIWIIYAYIELPILLPRGRFHPQRHYRSVWLCFTRRSLSCLFCETEIHCIAGINLVSFLKMVFWLFPLSILNGTPILKCHDMVLCDLEAFSLKNDPILPIPVPQDQKKIIEYETITGKRAKTFQN